MTLPFDLAGLVGHIRACLGEPADIAHAALGSVHVYSFPDQPMRRATTYVTVGLSRHVLEQESGTVRQELLISADPSWNDPAISGLLAHLAGSIALAGKPILWGEVVEVEAPYATILRVDFLLSIDPRYFDEGLAAFQGSEPETDISWMVPVTVSEAQFIATRGADAFLGLVVDRQPDLLKVRTRSVRGV